MWTINPSPNSFSNQRSLKFFGLSDLNVPTKFFRVRPSQSGGGRNTNPLAPTRPPIVSNPNPITPVSSAFLYKLEGNWTSTGITRTNSINQLANNRLIWLNGFTFVISDLTARTFVSQVTQLITDPINLGFFADVVTRVSVGGLNLDFTQVDGQLIITTDSKSCIGRIGQTATIWLEKELNPLTYDKNPVTFFSKVGTGIGIVTLFDYLGYNYLISTTLESFTLVNATNNQFFIVS